MSSNRSRKGASVAVPLVIFAFGVLLFAAGLGMRFMRAAPVAEPTNTAEPIVPTKTPMPVVDEATAIQVVAVTATAEVQQLDVVESDGALRQLTDDNFGRIGISGNQILAVEAWDANLRWTQFLDWQFTRNDDLPQALTYWRTLRINEDGWQNFDDWSQVLDEVSRFPGEIWIVGNEPDVKWQDGVSAEFFAEQYHDAYTTIKAADPSAQIAVGAVAAGTDLRLRYLDRMLAHYATTYGEPMPVDIWTVHAYVLREERNSWGIDIPPGMDDDAGDLYEIEDHDDLDIFTQQLVKFRRWMADNDYRDKPLAVTEFGILLPNDYGFPADAVAQYMRDTHDIMLTLQDDELGQPQDDNRLVQSMFWFVIYYDLYPTGALWDRDNGELSPLGSALQEYVGR